MTIRVDRIYDKKDNRECRRCGECCMVLILGVIPDEEAEILGKDNCFIDHKSSKSGKRWAIRRVHRAWEPSLAGGDPVIIVDRLLDLTVIGIDPAIVSIRVKMGKKDSAGTVDLNDEIGVVDSDEMTREERFLWITSFAIAYNKNGMNAVSAAEDALYAVTDTRGNSMDEGLKDDFGAEYAEMARDAMGSK